MSEQPTDTDAAASEDAAAALEPNTAEGEGNGEGEAAASGPPPASAQRRGPWVLTAVALLLAASAAAATGFLWWQYRQFYVSLAAADADAESSLQRLRANVRELTDRTEKLETSASNAEARSEALAARLDAVPGRLTELERQISNVQGVSFDARARWLRAEALYYLELASNELELAGHWETAITALELADSRLRELGDPVYGPVRSSIADKLMALRAVKLPDVAGLSYSLSQLETRAEELPLRGEPPERFLGRRDGTEQSEPGLGRLWLSLKAALASFVSIERRATPAERAVTPLARELTARQLAVELEVARLALLQGDADAFGASVRSARALLESDFDTEAASVSSAATFLERLLEVDIAPPHPDLSEPLDLLRRLPETAPQ